LSVVSGSRGVCAMRARRIVVPGTREAYARPRRRARSGATGQLSTARVRNRPLARLASGNAPREPAIAPLVERARGA
jgi:hypothetical protein